MDAKLKKSLGAYYTEESVADFLVSWAIKSPGDRILDPSYGDGVFLVAAGKQLESNGGNARTSVFGIDIKSQDILQIAIPAGNLIERDFFKVEPSEIGQMDAVVGNPPFIRYQRFNGDSRARALEICRQEGVALSALTSSWAPFLVHAIRFLKGGGRLAMVVPAEINHATYAAPVMRYLLRKFYSIKLILFRQRIFPDLSEDTFCLLADRCGEECSELSLFIADSASALPRTDFNNGTKVDIESIRTGETRLTEYLLPQQSRTLYSAMIQRSRTQRLGVLAEAGIGYVTGANDYFHLSGAEVRQHGIPQALLKPAVRTSRQLQGTRFTWADWEIAEQAGGKVWLLHIPPGFQPSESVNRYLALGLVNKIDQAYKCKSRSIWYSVPHVYVGDAFLSYMAGNTPRLVANDAQVVAPNTLHVVRLRPKAGISVAALAMLWHTSLTMLSSEIEGHALGGGMLKLEPSEAERVIIPLPEGVPSNAEITRLDDRLRTGTFESALDYADSIVLMRGLGLTKQDCVALREGYHYFRRWRTR